MGKWWMRLSETDRSVLVIGYGNSLRRDDGAGLILAEKLAAYWKAQGRQVELITAHQLEPEMAEHIAAIGAAAVVFVDAEAATTEGPRQIRLSPIPKGDNSPSLGHHFSPSLLMLYAMQLYGCTADAWLLTAPGYDFGHGEGLSDETRALIDAFSPGDLPV